MGSDSPAALLIDRNSNEIVFVLDGAIYRIPISAKLAKASDGSLIDPATEGGNLATIAGKDFATQTTLAAVKAKTDNLPSDPAREGGNLATLAGKDFATQTTLAAIKDTDGVKKITDQLPSGTNEIGKTAQGTRAVAGAGWPMYLVDADGHAVGLYLDGAIYRFRVDGKIGIGTSDLVHLDAIDTTSGRGRLKVTLFTQDGDPIAFGSVPPTPEEIYNHFCLNAGSESLLVNGSSTPVVFTYPAHAEHDISLQEIKFVLSANGITFGTNYFGGVAGPLTNGLLVEITAGGATGTVYNLKQNESFVNFASPGGFEWVVSSKDLMAATYSIGGGFKLKAGTSDCVKVTVRDNISSAGTYFKCFVKGHLVV